MSIDVNQNHVQMDFARAIQAEILHADKDAAKPSWVATNFALFGKTLVGKLLGFWDWIDKENMMDPHSYMRIWDQFYMDSI